LAVSSAVVGSGDDIGSGSTSSEYEED